MTPSEFADLHTPALEADEVRHNLILGMLIRAREGRLPELRTWTLGAPGHAALQTAPQYPIIIGALDDDESRRLAELTQDSDYLGVVGPDRTAEIFATRAAELGVAFSETVPQKIDALSAPPRYPGAPGIARPLTAEDADLFAAWMTAFHAEAVPFEPVPSHDTLVKTAAGGAYSLWVDGGAPVSMAGIVRRSRATATIAGVYTPPEHRGRGYAGSVTAAVVDRIRAEGRPTACLYTDLRNPAANRCYARVGFVAHCDSALILSRHTRRRSDAAERSR
jgi:predicted GNAT family acetyltransferase